VSLLEVEKLEAYYGASQVLFDVNLQVREGAVTALMGRNGMGKTTTIKAVTRLCRSVSGRVLFDGQEITSLPSHVVARRGIGLVPEGRRCFTNLTVDENLHASASCFLDWQSVSISRLPRCPEENSRCSPLRVR